MVTLLSKIFIKETEEGKLRQAYGVLCGAVGIFLNIVLFAGKFLAGSLTGSIAITADAFNNLSDAGSSLITLLGFKLAGAKPDPEHPFGHGRLEYISGFLVSLLIFLMSYELIKESVTKIIHPEAAEFSILAICILIASILVKVYMFFYNNSIGRKINSPAMKATGMDSLSDCISTSVVLICALISKYAGVNIDGYCGVLVGLFILYAAYNAAKETLGPLLGQSPDEEFVNEIEEIVMAHEGILGTHDLIVHDYGPGRVFFSIHAEVPAEGDILEMHDLIDEIERELNEKLNCMATIHMDPVVTTDERLTEYKEKIMALLKEIDEEILFHDFRMVPGPTHTNLIFDVVVPHKYKLSDTELTKLIQTRITEDFGPNFFAVICVDKAFA